MPLRRALACVCGALLAVGARAQGPPPQCVTERTTTTTGVTHPDGTEISVTTVTEPDSYAEARRFAALYTGLWNTSRTDFEATIAPSFVLADDVSGVLARGPLALAALVKLFHATFVEGGLTFSPEFDVSPMLHNDTFYFSWAMSGNANGTLFTTKGANKLTVHNGKLASCQMMYGDKAFAQLARQAMEQASASRVPPATAYALHQVQIVPQQDDLSLSQVKEQLPTVPGLVSWAWLYTDATRRKVHIYTFYEEHAALEGAMTKLNQIIAGIADSSVTTSYSSGAGAFRSMPRAGPVFARVSKMICERGTMREKIDQYMTHEDTVARIDAIGSAAGWGHGGDRSTEAWTMFVWDSVRREEASRAAIDAVLGGMKAYVSKRPAFDVLEGFFQHV